MTHRAPARCEGCAVLHCCRSAAPTPAVWPGLRVLALSPTSAEVHLRSQTLSILQTVAESDWLGSILQRWCNSPLLLCSSSGLQRWVCPGPRLHLTASLGIGTAHSAVLTRAGLYGLRRRCLEYGRGNIFPLSMERFLEGVSSTETVLRTFVHWTM